VPSTLQKARDCRDIMVMAARKTQLRGIHAGNLPIGETGLFGGLK